MQGQVQTRLVLGFFSRRGEEARVISSESGRIRIGYRDVEEG